MLGRFLLFALSISVSSGAWDLTLVHLNDIHSHLDPAELSLPGGIRARVGGAARLRSAVEELRREHPGLLVLHAGDELVGTPWFSLYDGLADAMALDRIGVDAFVPGNHEFDRGSTVLARFLDSLRAPALAANLGISEPSPLKGRVLPALTVSVKGRRVGIVGVANPGTPAISSPGPGLSFRAASTVRRAVDSLRRAGVATVVLLTHVGFEEDTVLAREIPGIAAVVGGHSHTSMGSGLSAAGLRTSLPYPVAVRGASGREVPVVQAGQWGEEVGLLTLHLDDSGSVLGWEGAPFLVFSDTFLRKGAILGRASADSLRRVLESTGSARFPVPDSGLQAELSRLSRPLDSLRGQAVARLDSGLSRRRGLGELCARALREAASGWGAQVGLQNPGGVREDLAAGTVTAEQVQRTLPFRNTVVVVALSGAELRSFFRSSPRRERPLLWDGLVEGRDGSLRLAGGAEEIRDRDTVLVATNSYLASGKDGGWIFAKPGRRRVDTGMMDADALSAILTRLHPATNANHSATGGKQGEDP